MQIRAGPERGGRWLLRCDDIKPEARRKPSSALLGSFAIDLLIAGVRRRLVFGAGKRRNIDLSRRKSF